MARRERVGLRKAVAGLGLALALTAGLAGCTSPRIRVHSSDAAVLRGAPAFEVALVPARPGADPALPAATSAALVERAREALRAKGYPVEDERSDRVLLELVLHKELVSRRDYTADTDANGVRLVKRTELLVALRALDAGAGTELWHGDARALLPERNRQAGPSEAELFDRLLDRALAPIPARP